MEKLTHFLHFCQTSLRLVLSEVKTLIQWTILCWKNTADMNMESWTDTFVLQLCFTFLQILPSSCEGLSTSLASPWPVKMRCFWGTQGGAGQRHASSPPLAQWATRGQVHVEQVLGRAVWGRGGYGSQCHAHKSRGDNSPQDGVEEGPRLCYFLQSNWPSLVEWCSIQFNWNICVPFPCAPSPKAKIHIKVNRKHFLTFSFFKFSQETLDIVSSVQSVKFNIHHPNWKNDRPGDDGTLRSV